MDFSISNHFSTLLLSPDYRKEKERQTEISESTWDLEDLEFKFQLCPSLACDVGKVISFF